MKRNTAHMLGPIWYDLLFVFLLHEALGIAILVLIVHLSLCL